jgi:hypothetical protein
MKQEYKILLIALITIWLFDTIGSVASKQFNFNYATLAPVSFAIYTWFGFAGARKTKLKTGVLIATATGFFDATIGWATSNTLKANTGSLNSNPTPLAWAITVIFVSGLAALCGLFGAWLAHIAKSRSKK